jgi:hypothetical protein
MVARELERDPVDQRPMPLDQRMKGSTITRRRACNERGLVPLRHAVPLGARAAVHTR